MNKLKYIIVTVTVIIIMVMTVATVVDSKHGTDYACANIYNTVWFVVLWAVLAVASAAYIMRRKLYKNICVFLVHASFVVILLGALVSWMTSKTGTVHLRQGEIVTKYELADDTTCEFGFPLKLKEFKITYYPGTDAPMDYTSIVLSGSREITVSMNNIGESEGYRFMQSSYDDDMRGTTLGVSYDPWGIAITYTGYFLLFVSLVWTLFSQRTRMRGFYEKALRPTAAKAVILALMTLTGIQANAQDRINIDNDICSKFARICVLYNGRICPINTVANDFVTKLSGSSSWNGMSADEVFAGWVFDAPYWETAKMIQIKDQKVQEMLGIQDEWAAVKDFWNQYNEYKLEKVMADLKVRGNDKALLKSVREADEKFNIVRMLYNGEMLRMYPFTDKQGTVHWLAPGERNKYGMLEGKEWYFVRKSMDYLAHSIITGDVERAKTLAYKIYAYQHVRGKDVMPSKAAVYSELVYNAVSKQKWSVILFLACSVLLIIGNMIWAEDCKGRRITLCGNVLLGVMLAYTTVMLILRWVISGHLPMSNGYETMQFMAWATLILTLALRRRFAPLSQFGPLLSAFALLVAMITDKNPQVTQLMPVLQSPLLSVHVMVIMFSYALFGIMALTSMQGLLMHHRGNTDREESLAAMSQFLLYPAVALIAIGIFIGAIWANVSWGRYWGWDSKEVWALITLLVYSAPLHNSLKWFHKPIHVHLYMLLAFLSVLMTYFGVNYILGGMHSYA